MGDELPTRWFKSLFYFTYLTGARITESLEIKGEDISKYETGAGAWIMVNLPTRKNRQKPEREILIPYDKTVFEEEKEMIDYVLRYKDGFSPEKRLWGPQDWEEDEVTRMRMRVAWHFKKLKWVADGYKEVEGHKPLKLPDHDFHMFPHYLRHCRFTHLVRFYKIKGNVPALMQVGGWKTPDMPSVYIQQSGGSLTEEMVPA